MKERLIEGIVLCGVRPSSLIDYISSSSETELVEKLSEENLRNNNITPEILSMHPNDENLLTDNFVDVIFL